MRVQKIDLRMSAASGPKVRRSVAHWGNEVSDLWPSQVIPMGSLGRYFGLNATGQLRSMRLAFAVVRLLKAARRSAKRGLTSRMTRDAQDVHPRMPTNDVPARRRTLAVFAGQFVFVEPV